MISQKLALLGLMALGTTAAWGTSVAAVTLTPNIISSPGSALSLGFEFSLSGAITVDSLGYFSPTTLTASHDVGIYSTGGTLLASTTVTSADAVNGNFTFHSIAPLALGPGSYYIMGETAAADSVTVNPTSVSFLSGITFVSDEYAISSALAPPSGTTGSTGYFGPNFTVTDNSTNATPEPSSVLLLSSGLLAGLGLKLRKKRQAK